MRAPSNVVPLKPPGPAERAGHAAAVRIAEALLFAASAPLTLDQIRARLPEDADAEACLRDLAAHYAPRGVNLVRVAGGFALRTAGDLAGHLKLDAPEPRRLSRPAMETLAIVAYHQPVTRAEIEEVRGVQVSKGTLDILLETGWVRPRGRRRAPGRPVTYGTTPLFLEHFGLDAVQDLPGLDELAATGFLEDRPAGGLLTPLPSDDAALRDDEEPLGGDLLSDEPLVDDEPSGQPRPEGATGDDGPPPRSRR